MAGRVQFAKFVLVGVVNSCWSYLLYAAFLYFGFNYWLASLLTIVLSVGFGFLMQGNVVFGGATYAALPRFVLVWIVIYALYLLVVTSAQWFGVNNYIGGLMALPLVACLSYVLQRRYVFQSSAKAEL